MPRFSASTKITKLKTVANRVLSEWPAHTDSVFEEARDRVADWAGVDAETVGYEELAGGDFFTVDGQPVAFLETTPVALPTPAPVPYLIAAE